MTIGYSSVDAGPGARGMHPQEAGDADDEYGVGWSFPCPSCQMRHVYWRRRAIKQI